MKRKYLKEKHHICIAVQQLPTWAHDLGVRDLWGLKIIVSLLHYNLWPCTDIAVPGVFLEAILTLDWLTIP